MLDPLRSPSCDVGTVALSSHHGFNPAKLTGLFCFRKYHYFTRRPLKNPALVVFCLILAVSPCSAVLTSPFVFDVSLLTSALSPVPLWLRLAGGTGGISLWRDMLVSFIELKNKRTGYLPGPLHLTFSLTSSFPSSWLYSCDLGTRPCLFATLRILPKSFPA